MQQDITAAPSLVAQAQEAGDIEIPAEAVASPPTSTVASVPPPSTVAHAPPSSTGDATPAFGIAPFPPPSATTPIRTPPTPHIGPADTDSVASLYSPSLTASRQGLNPRANSFDGAEAMRLRGQAMQPEVHDPMIEPPEREPGHPQATAAQSERRVNAAIGHAAMVYRYLSAADHQEAEQYSVTFTQSFGERYRYAVARAIQDEPDDPPSEQGRIESQGEDDDDQYD